jgi:alkylhydroperoxidase family enzyme
MELDGLPIDPQRVALVPADTWDPALLAFVRRAILLGEEDEPLNFYKAMVHHPKLTEKWTVFAARILGKSTLVPRERELVVLRTVWNCQATYEWVHHAEIGEQNGLSPEEIEAIKIGPDAPGWEPHERALLAAADELYRDDRIGDATWDALRERFDEARLLEIVMLAGNYRLVSYFVRTFGVPLEDDVLERAARR